MEGPFRCLRCRSFIGRAGGSQGLATSPGLFETERLRLTHITLGPSQITGSSISLIGTRPWQTSSRRLFSGYPGLARLRYGLEAAPALHSSAYLEQGATQRPCRVRKCVRKTFGGIPSHQLNTEPGRGPVHLKENEPNQDPFDRFFIGGRVLGSLF